MHIYGGFGDLQKVYFSKLHYDTETKISRVEIFSRSIDFEKL